MLKAKDLFDLVRDNITNPGEFLEQSGVQFLVDHHQNWCTYDHKINSLMDKGVVIPAQIHDINAVRIGDGGTPVQLKSKMKSPIDDASKKLLPV